MRFFFEHNERVSGAFKKLLTNKNSDDEDGEYEYDELSDKYNYLSMIDTLSNNDITKHNEIWDMSYVYSLNVLDLRRLQANKDRMLQQQINNKYK